LVIQQQSKENGVGLIFMSDEYFEAERNRIVRIQNINYKLVPQTSKSFEEGFVEGQKKGTENAWIEIAQFTSDCITADECDGVKSSEDIIRLNAKAIRKLEELSV